MPSSLTWLDHDAAAHERSATLLALMKEPETRDELGMGRIRDSLSDQLFPGTSVIQTRLRYMLLLPRMFIELESSPVAAKDFASRARTRELDLNDSLAAEEGAFGSGSGRSLKRLASSVYWAGMRSWGILERSGSQQDYYNAIGRIRSERNQSLCYEDGIEDGELLAPTWHPSIEKVVGSTALESGSLALTGDEAGFIREQWKRHHPGTMLVWLARDQTRLRECADAVLPWRHPQISSAPAPIRDLVEHARRFSGLAHGASLVYNLALAEASNNARRRSEYKAALGAWIDNLQGLNLTAWDMPSFWSQVEQGGKPVHAQLHTFVDAWLALVKADRADSLEARNLVRLRECELKRSLSRFKPENLTRWGGASGVGRLNYRWPTTQRHLADLLRGLEAA